MRIQHVESEVEIIGATEGRSSGVHISDIYGSLFKRLDPKRYAKDGPINPIYLAIGLAWERYLEERLIASGVNCERPAEQMTIGKIAFSPDLIIVNGEDRIGEIKVTWMSDVGNLDDPKFNKYHAQAMAYCKQYGFRHARFYVLFVVGDYKGSGPTFRVYDIEYTVQEIEENWSALMNHARHEGLV